MHASIQSFLRHLETERQASPHTLRSYRDDLDLFACYLSEVGGEGVDPTSVDARRLRSYLAWLGTRGYAASTVARRLASLRSFFRYQRRQGAVAADPAGGLRNPKQPKRLPSCWGSTTWSDSWTRSRRPDRLGLATGRCSRPFTAAACGWASSSGSTWPTSTSSRAWPGSGARAVASGSAPIGPMASAWSAAGWLSAGRPARREGGLREPSRHAALDPECRPAPRRPPARPRARPRREPAHAPAQLRHPPARPRRRPPERPGASRPSQPDDHPDLHPRHPGDACSMPTKMPTPAPDASVDGGHKSRDVNALVKLARF